MSKPNDVTRIVRPCYTLATTNGTKAELTLYGEIVESQPTDWWGDPIDGEFIILDEFLKDLETIKGCTELVIHLNSIGGDAFAAFTIHNRLRELKAKKTCIVDGVAMSGGSHIMCACDTVRVNPASIVMIHDCITFAFARLNSSDCANLAKQLDVVDSAQAEIYARKTGKSMEELKAMMDETTYLTGREAVEQGFADELIDDADDPDISVSADKRTLYACGHKLRFAALGKLPEEIKVIEPVPSDGGDKSAEPLVAANNQGGVDMTLEEFRAKHPDAAEELLNEAKASAQDDLASAREEGARAERERLAGIDEISSLYDAETVRAAKYGENRCSAEQLAFRAAQEMAKTGKTFLNQMKADYQESGAAGVNSAPAPEEGAKPETAEDMKALGLAMAKRLSGEKTEEV